MRFARKIAKPAQRPHAPHDVVALVDLRSSDRISEVNRLGSARGREDSHFFLQSIAELVFLLFQVETCLQIQPEPLRCPEVARETKCGIRRYPPRSVHDLIDPPRWNAYVPGQSILRDPEPLEKIDAQYLAWVNRTQLSALHAHSSVVVDYLDVVGVSILPTEADAPLLVDTNAVLASSLAFQLLKAIARWDSEVVQPVRCVHHHKFSQHHAPQCRWKRSHGLSLKQPLSPFVSEALYHLE